MANASRITDTMAQGVLGIGTYTLSTLANRMTGAPVDEPLQPLAWTGHAA
jgi:hypothetical protein